MQHEEKEHFQRLFEDEKGITREKGAFNFSPKSSDQVKGVSFTSNGVFSGVASSPAKEHSLGLRDESHGVPKARLRGTPQGF